MRERSPESFPKKSVKPKKGIYPKCNRGAGRRLGSTAPGEWARLVLVNKDFADYCSQMASSLVNNKYRITRRIGGGSFGEIYMGIGPNNEKVCGGCRCD